MVLKDKYFRHSDLLHAKLGHRPSLIWKNLWSSLELLNAGLVWRVGIGHNVRVWGDRWIPTPLTNCIQSLVVVLSRDARVSEFIDSSRGGWKKALIREVLNEDEARVVCSLSLSKSGMPDKQIWGSAKDGLFSVRSAYYLEVGRKRRERRDKSDGTRFDWKLIWNLNVPGVVKVFLWKALNDCLPTRRNLLKRRVVDNSCCPMCES